MDWLSFRFYEYEEKFPLIKLAKKLKVTVLYVSLVIAAFAFPLIKLAKKLKD